MGDDLIPILTRFHREILLPDVKRVVEASEQRLRDEMQTGLDSVARELAGLQEQVRTLEARLGQ